MVEKVGIVILLCLGSASSELQAADQDSQSGTLDFGFVPSGVYETHAYYEPGPIGILFHMVHAFLYVVQPNPFPRDLITKLAKENYGTLQAQYQKAIYYEMGFVVSAALGALFVLLVPLVGLCFCMCRCCDNCGGEMHQRQRKNADCKRGFFTGMLAVTSFIITLGVLCAYTANQNLSSHVKSMKRLVDTNMKDLKLFANDTPVQIDYVTAQYTVVKKKVLSDLDNIGALLGNGIHSQLGKEVLPALDGVLSVTEAMQETREALENVRTALDTLQDGAGKLQAELNGIRTSLRHTLSDPACFDSATCNDIRGTLSQLVTGANFSALPDVSGELARVDAVLQTDLSNIVQKGYLSFNDTPALVKQQTKDVVSGAKDILDGIGTNIASFSKMFPIHATLYNFTVYLTQSQVKIEAFYPQIELMDFYRWTGCIAICCLLVLILSFNFLGLLCGYCGYDKHASPTTRGCLSNMGGNLLMAGAGFSFIFSWVLMGVVTVTFVVGGNVEKLLCEPFENRELFKVIDTPYMVSTSMKNFLPGMLFQNPQIDLTLESVYSNCKEDKGVFSALKLDNIFHVNRFLNSSVYTRDMARIFEDVKVDLKGIVLLELAGRQNLLNFANTGVDEINYTNFLAEVNKGVTRVDLLAFASKLEALADDLPRGALENALKGHATIIRQIHSQRVVPMEQAMNTLGQSIVILQRTASDLPAKITDILNTIDMAEYLITQNATQVVKQETSKYILNIVGYFKQYIEWAKNSIELDVGVCKPLSNIMDTADIVACSFIVDSVNAFWFGLGCCTVLLIPNIILSVKLAKFYRRMDTEDVYDDMEIGNNGYHNQHLQCIPNPVMASISTYDTMTRFPRASAPPRHADW
ncbi:prominin-1-A-like isoform X9 [Brienomyrus brachyistius]|uniref:prominin-1-A-like isoform X9 n=1 Tax=Brienomyrus brachyistius TaxID=42636 RepID=UPI0020B3D808|nr:prominin-1-A-like isoform X9 [Brienomyrus brachyistius]